MGSEYNISNVGKGSVKKSPMGRFFAPLFFKARDGKDGEMGADNAIKKGTQLHKKLKKATRKKK